VAGLLALAAVVYGPSLRDAGFVLDDRRLLATHAHHGQLLGEWTHDSIEWALGTPGLVWMPIPMSLLHLVAMVAGREDALPFRLLALGVAVLNALLVHAVARRLEAPRLAAFGAAALALVHPVLLPVTCVPNALNEATVATFGLLGTLGVLTVAAPWAPLVAGLATLGACLSKTTGAAVLVPMMLAARRPAVGLGGAAGVLVFLGLVALVAPSVFGGAGAVPPLERVHAWLAFVGLLFAPPWSQFTHAVGGVEALWGAGLLALLAGAGWRLGWRGAALGAGVWLAVSAPSGLLVVPQMGFLTFRYAVGALLTSLPFFATVAPGRPSVAASALLLLAAALLTPQSATRALSYRDDASVLAADAAIEATPAVEIGRFHELAIHGAPLPAGTVERIWTIYTAEDPALGGPSSRVDLTLLAQVALKEGRLDIAEGAARAGMTRGPPHRRGEAACVLAEVLRRQGRPAEAGCR